MDHSLISLPPILSHSLFVFLPTLPSLPSHLLFLPSPPPHFPGDELENIIGGLRNEVKSAGMQDTRENCWSFFIERVRRQLKVKALCVCVCLFVCLFVCLQPIGMCAKAATQLHTMHRFNYPCNLLPLTRWYCVSPLWAPPCGCVPGSSLPL